MLLYNNVARKRQFLLKSSRLLNCLQNLFYRPDLRPVARDFRAMATLEHLVHDVGALVGKRTLIGKPRIVQRHLRRLVPQAGHDDRNRGAVERQHDAGILAQAMSGIAPARRSL